MSHGVRLAFRGNKVVEAKNMKTGATHTPAEFAADRARRKRGPSEHAKRLAAYQVSRRASAPAAARHVAARRSARVRKGTGRSRA